LISPVSALIALSMMANGADGSTLSQMEQVLGAGMSVDEINKYLYTYHLLL
jgi:serpin B